MPKRNRKEYFQEYKRRKDPYFGRKINSKPQAREFLSKLLREHPEGLTLQQCYDHAKPFEGRLHLSPDRVRGFLAWNMDTGVNDGVWMYIGDLEASK